jgi:hypothetical protein
VVVAWINIYVENESALNFRIGHVGWLWWQMPVIPPTLEMEKKIEPQAQLE